MDTIMEIAGRCRAAQLAYIKQMSREVRAAQFSNIKQMNRQLSRGSAGDY